MKKNQKTILLMVIMAAAIITLYLYLVNRDDQTNSPSTKTEVGKLLSKDFETSYPSTPTSVLDMYKRILKCFYNQGLKEKEVDALADQMRILFDDELLEANPRDKYIEKLKQEIKEFKKSKREMMETESPKSSEAEYSTIKKEEYATVQTELLFKEKDGYSKTFEQFIFRKDAKGNWKILGWKEVVSNETEE